MGLVCQMAACRQSGQHDPQRKGHGLDARNRNVSSLFTPLKSEYLVYVTGLKHP